MQDPPTNNGAIAFALIYLTFFLDNVLLTVLVPIIPDWIRGEALALWAAQDAPLAGLLNHTVTRITQDDPDGSGHGSSQAVLGLVLGAKAAAQLVWAPLAAGAVSRRGAAPVLRAATATLAAAALGFTLCSGCGGATAALCVCAARAAHGAGAALGGVAGLALAAAALPPQHTHRGIGHLLGAVALGVLVGYPFGGATYALWSRGAPFLLLAAALLANLAMQYMFLDKEEYSRPLGGSSMRTVSSLGVMDVVRVARRGCTGACAGCVLLTTCVMAALEPCLPLWLARKFHPARWQTGAVFVPDSVGYLLAASGGGLARRLGAERVALAGQLALAAAAWCVPLARSLRALAAPHFVLGAGLGAADAALVPALLARSAARAPATAALLQAAGSAAYALGPVLGGLLAAAAGFETAMRVGAVINLLYAGYLYTRLRAYPISEQWGASADCADSDDDASDATLPEGTPLTPLAQRTPLTPLTQRTPLTPLAQRTPLTPLAQRTPLTPLAQRTPQQYTTLK